jgi:proteasome lid subunit RPN8/RPN11
MIIGRAAYEAMVDHMVRAAPQEGCGLLAGPHLPPPCPRDTNGDGDCGRRACPHCGADGHVVDTWVPMDNIAEHPRVRFEVDGAELVKVWQALDDVGRRPWAVCHSHPRGPATPSDHDLHYATDRTLLHLIVGTDSPVPVVRLWRIELGAPAPVRVLFEVVDLGRKENPPTDLTRGVSSA